MKTLITIFAILLFSTGLFAQKFVQEWYIELPGLGTHAVATAIISTQDNNLFIAGPSNSSSSNGTMFYMKTDTAGNVIQTTFAEEQFNDTYQYANRLMEDKDNNFVMVGTYSYYHSTYFTKLSPAGETISAHVNGSQNNYQGGHDAVQTLDGGYLVSAQNEIYGSGMTLALRKLDSLGNFIWDTTLVHPADSTPIVGNFGRMAKIDDSTFVLTGQRDYAPGSAEDLDVLLTKIRVCDDSVRVLNLTIFQQDGTNERGYDILNLPNNQGYVICGVGPNESNANYTVGIIMHTDTAGNLMWKKSYTRALNSSTSFIRVLLDDEDNILVLARTSGGSSDASLLKYSLDGDLLQKTHFDFGVNETAYDMTISQEGKIYISASTYSLSSPKALLLKVKDICPLITPEATLADTMPNMGDDVVVNVQNTNDAWSYSLIQINGEVTLSTLQGNGGILNLNASGLDNEDVSQGLLVSVIEPGVDCIKYSDTLHLEFICPLVAPEVFLVDTTLFFGDDVVVTAKNTDTDWKYSLIQINEHITLDTTFGNGGDYNFTVSGLTNDDVAQGLVVSVVKPGMYCIEFSDTLYPKFVDGIEDRYQNSLQITPNPFHDFITITDSENNKLSKVSVFNSNGQRILEKAIFEDYQNINLAHYPKGIYFIRVTYKNGNTAFRKVIKK